jgi:sulfite reductase (NADPH) flavoprotein alpha-component
MAAEQKQHFTGRHLINLPLTGAGSNKDTRHHEIGIEASTPPSSGSATYLPGDALGVPPRNSPQVVEAVMKLVGAGGDEMVPSPTGAPIPLHTALTEICNLTTPSRRLFELLVERGAADLAPLMDKANASALKAYLSAWNDAHDVLDVLESHASIRITPDELVTSLRSMLPRLYSIASSLKAHPGQVHLLVVSVRYTIRGRERAGVCSTFLADRWPVGDTVPLYLQNQQKHFAMPASGETPMIMVGPGTGLAPFRAFIEERRVLGAAGRNWLFFGEQRSATDFFYREQFSEYVADGFLRLDTAFSRDQAEKVYVQHRMREQARDIWTWLEGGAEFFVCGDKERMAADVDAELHRIAETEGGRTTDQAREYIDALKKSGRYKRDVY